MLSIASLHYEVLYILILVLLVVLYMLVKALSSSAVSASNKMTPLYLLEYTMLELV